MKEKTKSITDYTRLKVSIFDRIRWWVRDRVVTVNRGMMYIHNFILTSNFPPIRFIRSISFDWSLRSIYNPQPYEYLRFDGINTIQLRIQMTKHQRVSSKIQHSRLPNDAPPAPESIIEVGTTIEFDKITPFLGYIMTYFNPEYSVNRRKSKSHLKLSGETRNGASRIAYFTTTRNKKKIYTLDLQFNDALRSYVESDKFGMSYLTIEIPRFKNNHQSCLLCGEILQELGMYEYNTKTRKYSINHILSNADRDECCDLIENKRLRPARKFGIRKERTSEI